MPNLRRSRGKWVCGLLDLGLSRILSPRTGNGRAIDRWEKVQPGVKKHEMGGSDLSKIFEFIIIG